METRSLSYTNNTKHEINTFYQSVQNTPSSELKDYWLTNKNRFPVLFELVRIVLSVPATSAQMFTKINQRNEKNLIHVFQLSAKYGLGGNI